MRTPTLAAPLAAAVIAFALSACAPAASPGVDSETSQADAGQQAETDETPLETEAAPAEQGECSSGILESFAYNGPYMEGELSIVESAFGVDLPGGAECVVFVPGDSAGTAFFRIFWPGEDQNFANTVGNSLVAAGVPAYGDPISYSTGGANISLWAYPAGDNLHWSEYFDGSPQLVVGEGNIPDDGYFD